MPVAQALNIFFLLIAFVVALKSQSAPIMAEDSSKKFNFDAISETLLYKTVSHLRLALQKDIQLTDIKQCSSPNCVTFASRSGIHFFIQVDPHFTASYEVSSDAESKTLIISSLDFFDLSEKSIDVLKQFVSGHERQLDFQNASLKNTAPDSCEKNMKNV